MKPVLLALLLALLWPAAAHADECWIHTPPGYQGIGGRSRIGPYPDWYAANRVNNQYFNGQGYIECTKSPGGGGGPRFKYGAAKFHNRTAGTISFSVRRSPRGSWSSVNVESGKWYWWWQECPCRFHCTWDGSFAAGYQKRTREVFWYGYGSKPSDKDARDWQFVQRGQRIDLIPGSSEKIPSTGAGAGGSRTVSFVGSGEGRTHAKDFRSSKVADGTWKLEFMPRVNGVIPLLQGSWRMQWKRIVGDRKARVRTEIWNLSMSGFHGPGKRRQSVEVRMVGGAGTASFFTTKVPMHGAAGSIRLKVHIQFNGGRARLSFTRAY